ncbi:hypothetical protein DPX16_17336 [Anabarilius grahami]|uniref:Uncharacterized protein n=1 Tax=Anabarilius grahami TaxID=495550 RepID=A0A3N0XYP7_ANAGA|nr:hypothetical protein DPX16_17336 [Anabarilius grahami]
MLTVPFFLGPDTTDESCRLKLSHKSLKTVCLFDSTVPTSASCSTWIDILHECDESLTIDGGAFFSSVHGKRSTLEFLGPENTSDPRWLRDDADSSTLAITPYPCKFSPMIEEQLETIGLKTRAENSLFQDLLGQKKLQNVLLVPK